MRIEAGKKKALRYFVFFLIAMFVCTLISRGIYAMRLPKVTMDTVQTRSISHEVKASGMVEALSEEAVWTKENLRVQSVFVKEGENIESGAQLFQLEEAAIRDAIAGIENEIAQIDAGLSASDQNTQQAAAQRQTAIDRANADKQTAIAAADQAVAYAQAEVTQAQAALDQCPAKESYENEQAWASAQKELSDTLAEKQKSLQDAIAARSAAEVTANRAIEDASAPLAADSSDEVSKLSKEQKVAELAEYQALADADGIVSTDCAGSIAKLNVAVGELTPSGAAAVIETAGDTVDFVTQMTKEDKKYVEQGDAVTIDFSDKSTYSDGVIDELRTIMDEGGTEIQAYEVHVRVPSDQTVIGRGGELTVTKDTDPYRSTVPLEALYTDGKGYFVYTTQTTETILGQEISVQKRAVDIADKNNQYAALAESSGLSEGDSVVVYSDRELSAGAKVRLLEE